MKKDELRRIYLAKRKALSPIEHSQLSQQLCDQFFNTVDLTQVSVLHIYLPIEAKREPDTWLIIKRIQKEFSRIRIAIPRVNHEELDSIEYQSHAQLKKNEWQIWEPHYGSHVNSKEIDLLIIPLLVFDVQGHRIGYGRGYYDRFSKSCRADCIKVGLSFFEPEKTITERLEVDLRMNECITPNKKYLFNTY
ncbi:MAG TPA: 5-formyltetrahydrofolate cyclo-ligase [Cyclobacteriaceae bacterium]|nr:5-formyltetrahydrofolate cyclo-ligase [Cyclobacteriaceae bacterium]HPW62384.1 5-formyltetrahydrofolate cyclo-ligase [Cyclobacteriaceae bacterium]